MEAMLPPGGGPGTAGEGPVPTPEELMAFMEMLEQSGISADQVPADLKTMLDNVKRQKTGKGGAAPPDAATEEITPEPGFVIKTSEVVSGRKVFINVCSSDRVAAPGGWDHGLMPDEVAKALDKMATDGGANMSASEVEALRFPLSCGPPRLDTDRKGDPCTTIDVIFNADVVRAAGAARKLKALLIEVCTGWVAGKVGSGVELNPRYKLPKMRYKGEVVASQRIRADDKRKKLVTELRDVEEEPSFALRTKKAPERLPPPPAPARPAAGPGAGSSGGGGSTAAASKRTVENVGPAAAAAAAAGPAAGAAARGAGAVSGVASMLGDEGPSYKVEYEGRPVDWVRVTVDLAAGPSRPPSPSDVAVEVCGRSLFVRLPGGRGELHVPLLFAASAEGAAVSWQKGPGAGAGQLVVRLPYRSLDEYLANARAQAPLAFGQISFASKALLELEP
ncbi:PIH1 domain-containing protein 1 [Tetrabaena socialis]|uniref:PIH1 domain-containing protein 1 n=1 Tax=Tetrabaena socialis TaxID=47790 RepID=A0A2J8ACD9_9CHLO|nr:PIH1 domain-containing protein 1 [Tetrabaena socialis]|eukprot:PNH10184.1 PIH1 domain-containing protein 1 [Tetrabaena socialis]